MNRGVPDAISLEFHHT